MGVGYPRPLRLKTLTLDGTSLTLGDLAPLARGEDLALAVDPATVAAVEASRRMVDERIEKGEVVYGLTTGFGQLKNQAIAPADLEELQRIRPTPRPGRPTQRSPVWPKPPPPRALSGRTSTSAQSTAGTR